jgi:uncharacterized protein (TIGR02996 family)
MTPLNAILASIVADPDPATYLVLADWLEEHDDPRRAELLRLHQQLLATCCEPDRHPERAAWHARLVELLAEGVKPCVPQRTVLLGEGVEMTFSWIPPGSFLMGSLPKEGGGQFREVQHRVTLTRGFFLGTTPVTRGQFARFAHETGHVTEAEEIGWAYAWTGRQLIEDPGRNWRTPGFEQTDEHPTTCLSWHDGVALCEWLTRRERRGHRYCLPTEAQWESACRAGTTTPFHFGGTLSPSQANYDSTRSYNKSKRGKKRGQTTPVGSFPPNAWGLYDLHGNVWEWCRDWLGEYTAEAVTDPEGVPDRPFGVLRGGSWGTHPGDCRSAFRRTIPHGPYEDLGCRVCLCLD